MAQITQRIEMATGVWNGVGSPGAYSEQPGVATRLDTSAFDGTVTYYFEVALQNNGTAGQTAFVELYNHTDGSSVTSSELSTTNNSGGFPLRLRSGALTLSGDKIYTVRLKHSNTAAGTVLLTARIIVVQSGTITKTQIHQELGAEATTTSTSNTNILTPVSEFLYEASKYDGTVTIRHDANIKTTASNTATSGIYDVTAGAVVTSSEVAKTNDSNYTLLSSSDITLVDGHTYRPTAYVSAGATVQFESSKLVFTITGGFTKFLAYVLSGIPVVPGSGFKNSTFLYPNFQQIGQYYPQYDTADFSGFAISTYLEGRISINNAAQTVYSDLETYIYATSAAVIPGAQIAHTGDTAITRVRSGSFSMPAGSNDLIYGVSASVGTNAATVYTQHLILQVSIDDTISTSELISSTDTTSSYSDNVFTRESINIQVTGVNDLNISVSDSTTLTESSQVTVESNINKSESVILTESLTLLESVAISASDSITVTENMQRVLESFISKSESATVSEFLSVFMPDLYANVSDSGTLTEALQRQLLSFINVSDSVTVSESLQRLLQSFISVSDSTTLSESIKLLLESRINVSDSTTLSELVSIYEQERIVSVSDSIAHSESVKLLLESYVNKSDSVTVAESTQLLIPTLFVNVNDTITTSESVNVILPEVGVIVINVQDSVTITESVLRSDVPNPVVTDTMTVSESVSVRLLSFVSVSEAANLTEFINLTLQILFVTVQDTISVTEAKQLALTPLIINVIDASGVSESIVVSNATTTFLPRLGLLGVF